MQTSASTIAPAEGPAGYPLETAALLDDDGVVIDVAAWGRADRDSPTFPPHQGMVRLSTFYDPDGTPWMLAQTLDGAKADRGGEA